MEMPNNQESNAGKCLAFCSLFESEVLVWLMLRNWSHRLPEDDEYRSQIIETAAGVLSAAAVGSREQVFYREFAGD